MQRLMIILGIMFLGAGFLISGRGSNIIKSITGAIMKTSPQGQQRIKNHEGLRLTQYKDAAGFATIGYGHLLQPGEIDIYKTITLVQAENFFQQDLLKAENCVINSVKVPLTQNQFDALVSFVYNLGCGNFQKSTLLKDLNAGNYVKAANEILRWNQAGGRILAGLVKRREDERQLFLA